MKQEEMLKLMKELNEERDITLKRKNRKYGDAEDALHNFKAGSEIVGGTPAQACWGYLTKHLVALRDRVARNDFSDIEDVREKCKDSLNYILFLWCIANEEHEKEIVEETRLKAAYEKSMGGS